MKFKIDNQKVFSLREFLLLIVFILVFSIASFYIYAEDLIPIPPATLPTQFVILQPENGTIDTPVIINIQAQDAGGNIVSTYQGGVTLVASGHADGAKLVSIVNGQGSLGISDASLETVRLFLSDTESTGLNVSSTKRVIFGPGAAVNFTLNSPDDTTVDSRVGYIVYRRDKAGNQVKSGATTVYFYTNSTSGASSFYDLQSNGNIITSIIIPDGSSSIEFWYQDQKPGNYSITVSDNSLAPDGATGIADASDSIILSGGVMNKFVLNHPRSVIAGDRVKYTVSRKDIFNNLFTVGSNTAYLYTSSNSQGAVFYDSESAGNIITSISILDGSSSVDFWYLNADSGTDAITSSDNSSAPDGATGIIDASDSLTINAIISTPVEPPAPIEPPPPVEPPAPVQTPPPSGGGGGGGGGGNVSFSGGGNSTPDTPVQVVLPAPKIGDANKDGTVDELDFSILMSQWGQNQSDLPGDINKDKTVDEIDFSILMSNWNS